MKHSALLPLSLSVRCRHSLAKVGIVTIDDLNKATSTDEGCDSLLSIRNFATLNYFELEDHGLVPAIRKCGPNYSFDV